MGGMYAKRFRLDKDGNLHADRLFCRHQAEDPGLLAEATAWAARHYNEARLAKSQAILGFEKALDEGNEEDMATHARAVHVLMLSQRIRNPPRGKK